MMTKDDNSNSNFISALINAHVKPIVKEAIKEFLIENNLTLVSTVAPSPSKLLSTAQVAEMCGVNRHRIYEMIDEGLPFIEKKPFKFRLDDVNNFIAQNVKYRKKEVK
jgi:predicted DNA-binding transcriptional regulator AlpA